MNDSRIVLATPSPAYEQRVRQAFRGELNGQLTHWRGDALADRPEVAAKEILAQEPEIVAVGPGVHPEIALELAIVLDRERPDICVLLVTDASPQLWEHALRAGVRDVLAPDASDSRIREAFDHALETAVRRRRVLSAVDDHSHPGHVVTVVSPKGGSGKTTVASNLAVGLARKAPGEVVIVDLDLQFGDVATALQLVPEKSFADVARAGVGDVMAVKVFLTDHSTQLFALCAPESPVEGEIITAEQTRRVVGLLADEFRYVVIDTSAGIGEHTLSALELSTDVVLVCSMDVPSVRSLRKEVAAMDQLGMTNQRRHFVLNRADARVGLDPGDIETTVGMPIDVSVPSSRTVPVSMNQGSPVVESEPRSPAARALQELVERFVDEPVARSTRLLRWRRNAG